MIEKTIEDLETRCETIAEQTLARRKYNLTSVSLRCFVSGSNVFSLCVNVDNVQRD